MAGEENRRLRKSGLRRCLICREIKSVDQFYLNNHGNRQSYCKPCSRVYAQQQRMKDPKRTADIYRRKNLGVPLGTYDFLVKRHGEICAICGTTNPGRKNKQFCVDHDSQTKVVRGLLCNHCNMGIGYLRHSVPIFMAAVAHLNGKGYRIADLQTQVEADKEPVGIEQI